MGNDMKNEKLCEIFDALSQPNRLKIFKILVKYSEEGITPTEISKKMANMPRNTLSFHLSLMSNCGLCVTKKQGKQVIYFAKCETIRKVAAFLLKDCCDGGCKC